MILADTSVWIDHLRKGDRTLQQLLDNRLVITHPMLIGEIAVGSFQHREELLEQLSDLPKAQVADHDEALRFISHHKLYGVGIGYIDAHLLASAQLTPDAALWTRDNALLRATQRLRLDFTG